MGQSILEITQIGKTCQSRCVIYKQAGDCVMPREGVFAKVITGGTGLGPRDVTVDAVSKLIERRLPGVAEAMRAFGQKRTPYAMLSRGLAGVIGKTVVVTLPGSSRGAAESMDAILPYLFHIYPMLDGKGH